MELMREDTVFEFVINVRRAGHCSARAVNTAPIEGADDDNKAELGRGGRAVRGARRV
jgi:hypothetical protein